MGKIKLQINDITLRIHLVLQRVLFDTNVFFTIRKEFIVDLKLNTCLF